MANWKGKWLAGYELLLNDLRFFAPKARPSHSDKLDTKSTYTNQIEETEQQATER